LTLDPENKNIKTTVSDPYSFDPDPDPVFQAEYRAGAGKKKIWFKTYNFLGFR
jgi:hypothetical protein